MPEPLPNVLTTPVAVAGDTLAYCVNNPIGVIAAGIFVGLAVDAVLILAEQSYQLIQAYRQAIRPT